LTDLEPIVNHIRQGAATEPGAAKRHCAKDFTATGIPPHFLRTNAPGGAFVIVSKSQERY
jgi:hypothetical protein